MQAAGQLLLIFTIALALLGVGAPEAAVAEAAVAEAAVAKAAVAEAAAAAPLLQSLNVTMTSPPACPPEGCAAGQRLSMRFSFDPSGYDSGADPNVKICIYAPTSWNVSAAWAAATGEVTGTTYTSRLLSAAQCAQNGADPANYRLLLDMEAQLGSGAFADAVSFSLRLGSDASGSGVVLARLFINDGTGWVSAGSATGSTLSITPAASPAYVANDLNGCGSYTPCYLNSAGDYTGGLGTGLKDALDAAPANGTVTVIGNYSIRANTVVVDRGSPITITGMSDAAITYSGSNCGSPTDPSRPMLSLRSGVTVRGLNINDGSCTNPNLTLLEVDSDETALIESNDLNNGDNAIFISDNSGAVTVRFNEITGNGGHAIYAEGTSRAGPLEITANNLNGNTYLLECGADATGVLDYRRANHNYWGTTPPTAEQTHCTVTYSKRLGMPILHRSGAPGVEAQLVQVTDSKTYAFSNQIAYQRTGGANFPLYIVNHGYVTPGGPPFTLGHGGESPSPCGNYFDVFLPSGVAPSSGALDLSFKYDKTSGCVATINSSQYCDQTTSMGKYPLFWFDPSGTSGVTKWWDYVGARPEGLTSGEGQITRCNMNLNEIQVSIDNSGRPSLTGDLGYTPFFAGVPVLRSFNLFASNQAVTVSWSTNNEPDIDSFYVWRSTDGVNFFPISDRILHTGTALVGKSYFYPDTGRTNGVTYWYRLEIRRTDGASIYSAITSIQANIATITPTPTRPPTWTPVVIYATNTRVFTRVPPSFPTRVFTNTPFVRQFTPSATFLVLPTLTNSPLPGMEETPLPDGSLTPEPLNSATAQAIANLPGSTTPTPNALTATPVPPAARPSGPNPWLSLMLGLLGGLAAVAGLGGWWYYRVRH